MTTAPVVTRKRTVPTGTWSPWYFWAVGVWAVILAVHAFKTYAHRPPTEAEIRREVERLKEVGT
jgi:hypothetical protein